MRVTKVYDNGLLVSCKRVGDPKPTEVDTRSLAALEKEFMYEMESFLLNVSALKKELELVKRLLISRTAERNSVKAAHRQRLAQVYSLKEKVSELKTDYYVLQEDMTLLKSAQRTNSTQITDTHAMDCPSAPSSEYTFGVKAKAVKKR